MEIYKQESFVNALFRVVETLPYKIGDATEHGLNTTQIEECDQWKQYWELTINGTVETHAVSFYRTLKVLTPLFPTSRYILQTLVKIDVHICIPYMYYCICTVYATSMTFPKNSVISKNKRNSNNKQYKYYIQVIHGVNETSDGNETEIEHAHDKPVTWRNFDLNDPGAAEMFGLDPDLFNTYREIKVNVEEVCGDWPDIFWANTSSVVNNVFG